MNAPTTVPVRVTAFPAPFGRLLAAATDQGLLALEIVTTPEAGDDELERWVEQLRPGRRWETTRQVDDILQKVGDTLQDYFDRHRPIPPVPLDLSLGTDFHRQVWQALCRIPYGETRTYQNIADQVGRPRAARAVGQACGRNPIPIIVPCHRVITSGGTLGGFGSGLPIKRFLLDLEQATA